MDLEDAKKVVAGEASKLKESKALQIQKDWLLGNVVPSLESVFFPFIRCLVSQRDPQNCTLPRFHSWL
jgi:hypothetical protein